MLESPKAPNSPKSRIISSVLSPALRLWLRSQVQQVETLHFQILGGDRQILTGHIPGISIQASNAVYQGLHLSRIQLEGSNIRVNLGQVIKGQPMRLLEPVPVTGQLLLLESDIQSSLGSALLSNALRDLLSTLLASDNTTNNTDDLPDKTMSWQKIILDPGQFTLFGTLTTTTFETTAVVISAGLNLVSPRELLLHSIQIQINPNQPPQNLEPLNIDLGPEVALQELTLSAQQLLCSGSLKVIP